MTLIGSNSDFRDGFLRGAAKAFFTMAYADYVENDGAEFKLPRPGPGSDWTDYIPEIPPNAYALAGELWAGLYGDKRPGGYPGPYNLRTAALNADGTEPDPEEFGFCLAMMAMGTGVSWFDSHKVWPAPPVVPHLECGAYSFSEDAYYGER